MAEAFERLVVQIHVGDFQLVEIERIGVDGESVIVRGDFDLSGDLIQHRMIGAAMAELQLVGLAAQREAQDLMAQADAEDRDFADQFADLRGLVVERLGIAGAVREKHAVGLQRQHIFGGGAGRDHRNPAAGMHQAAQDVALDAEIVGDHVMADLGVCAFAFGGRAADQAVLPVVAFRG